jgi:uncharacterized protein YkwD
MRKLLISVRMVPVMAAVALTVAACGGGGGGGSTAGGGTPTTYSATCADSTTQTSTVSQSDANAKCPTASTIVNAALPVASTYAASGLTEELTAFNLLNSERERCGFGTLTQNAALDKAAKAHADWQNLNDIFSHLETAGTPGFTGIGASDQIAAAGYANLGAAGVPFTSVSYVTNKLGLGVKSVRGLLNAPYHMRDMLEGYREIGVAARTSGDVSTSFNTAVFQLDLAYTSTAGKMLQSSSDVLTYPCDGTTGTDRQLTGEVPNPTANLDGTGGRNLATSPLGGSVFVQLRYGNTLAITSATMTQVSNGAAVILRTPVTSSNSGNAFLSHQGYVAADAPLLANTSYQVTIDGTNNGTAFSRSFTFTTGTGG